MAITNRMTRILACIIAVLGIGLAAPACGGTAGGPGPSGAGQGLVLVSFIQDGTDNLQLNVALEFRFSEPVNLATITPASIQIRQGDAFGLTVPGKFRLAGDGSVVVFEPQLPTLCDLSNSGFQPDTQYRVSVIGWPEEFAVQNTSGQKLNFTSNHEFHTRLDNDPQKFQDQVVAVAPSVTVAGVVPANGAQAVTIGPTNQVFLPMSENLDPCSVSAENIIVEQYATGDPILGNGQTAPNNNTSGFYAGSDTSDQTPNDPFTWGADVENTLATPQIIPSSIVLNQTLSATDITITPLAGQWPDNSLIVIRLTFNVVDFAGLPLTPFTMSFTTENTPAQFGKKLLTHDDDNPNEPGALGDETTGDHDTARAPNVAQGFMLFAGDGDNGTSLEDPSLPADQNAVGGCAANVPLQANANGKDDFDAGADMELDTGAAQICVNSTDGSTAVIWEFATFRIRSGATVRVIGRNPAIILSQGDVVIENNGTLKVRGDNVGNSPQSNGKNGQAYQAADVGGAGGEGVAGGGDGGNAEKANQNPKFGEAGHAGFGSAGYDPNMASPGGDGAGLAGNPCGTKNSNQYNPWDMTAAGGGGAGHAEDGTPGMSVNTGTIYELKLTASGLPDAGLTYEAVGNNGSRLQTPEAGSGGGSGGFANLRPWNNSSAYRATGGGGGAGGGFVDVTSSGDIFIFGTIDAAGGSGGNGSSFSVYVRGAGGGGGSGGGIRLLTPNEIVLAATTSITTAGGGGGFTPKANSSNVQNHGGAGAIGRVVMEDGDSIISGLGGAAVTPTEGSNGFYRGNFDAGRFQGGGLEPVVTTNIFLAAPGINGPSGPTYADPVVSDYVAGIPAVANNGGVCIQVEARSFDILPDGTPDLLGATAWQVVGTFSHSGIDNAPNYTNVNGLNAFSGNEYLQVRYTYFLPASIGPFDPGGFIDDFCINFTTNN